MNEGKSGRPTKTHEAPSLLRYRSLKAQLNCGAPENLPLSKSEFGLQPRLAGRASAGQRLESCPETPGRALKRPQSRAGRGPGAAGGELPGRSALRWAEFPQAERRKSFQSSVRLRPVRVHHLRRGN
ncbi:hypothetical protein AOLI_G00015710 [Acnodon oligacanthus]